MYVIIRNKTYFKMSRMLSAFMSLGGRGTMEEGVSLISWEDVERKTFC